MLEPEQISPADPLAETSGCKQFELGLAEVSCHCPKFRTVVSLSEEK
jgi:hypothetical protein